MGATQRKATSAARLVNLKTDSEYQADLIHKFGLAFNKEQYSGAGTPIRHECQSCKQQFKAAPNALLVRVSSDPWCHSCIVKNRQLVWRREFGASLEDAFDNIRVAEFAARMDIQSKFHCFVCDTDFKARPQDVLAYKRDCCPKCLKGNRSKPLLTKKEYNEKLKPRGVKLVGQYHGAHKETTFKCGACERTWSSTPSRVVVNGCKACRKTVRTTVVTHQKKQFKVQGYESQVLEYLVTDRKIKATDIEVFSSGKVPVLTYRWMGQEKEYWPDMLVKGKTILEVKSTYWLFHSFKANVEKAKAAVKAGYKFRLAVHLPNATDISDQRTVATPSVLLLDPDWYTKSEEEVRAFLWRKQLPVDRIHLLAMDPGTTNFAWTVLAIDVEPLNVQVLATGMLQNPLKGMSGDIRVDVSRFKQEIRAITDEYDVHFFAAERYMTRGIKGTTIEAVNVMLGVLTTMFSRHPWQRYELVMASQWKNEWNRNGNLEAFYKTTKCEVHQSDSMGIGLYCAYRWLAYKPFHDLKSRVRSLAKQMTKTNIMEGVV